MVGLILALLLVLWLRVNYKYQNNTIMFSIMGLMPATGLGFLIWNYVQDRQIAFKREIEVKLMNLGYAYMSERPLTFGETIESAPSILINGLPIGSFTYEKRYERMIRVRNQIGVELLLHASVIIAKSRVRLEIRKKVRVDDAKIKKP
ncbi:MAG TPA: hypothetical protein PLX35_07845 [Cyclobacteriaceae bacterium]|nr:hypothetical protein [Cyclobacteriaceae bacterium]